MAHVNIAIGVRRTIMQCEGFLSCAFLLRLMIDIFFHPSLQQKGFALRQISLHRKAGFGQIECRFVIRGHAEGSLWVGSAEDSLFEASTEGCF